MPPRAAPPKGGGRVADPLLRPTEDFVVVPVSIEMQNELDLLSTNCAVAWLGGARQNVSYQHVAAELATTLGAQLADVEVARHYLEQFFVCPGGIPWTSCWGIVYA
ncbi:hypothetical protein ZWY2020_044935 [Hordeum vulgare]|nr:hypothetical protein ZWY2020_044935 [Hordeum vulgare]